MTTAAGAIIKLPFFSIGHSDRGFDEFAALLKNAQIGIVADIRSFPQSRSNSQFNQEVIADSLAKYQIAYQPIPALGGRRGKDKTIAPERNGFWQHQSFHNYADYALSAGFHQGLTQLITLGRDRCCAMMCAEAVWWRCHRRIVTDYLIAQGETVFHLMDHNKIVQAQLTTGAKMLASGVVVYHLAG